MAAEASLVLKRLREDEEETRMTTKRHKYSHYNQILSLLDDQDYGEEPSLLIHDNVSSFITTLQHELSSHDHQHPADPTLSSSSSSPAAIDSSIPSSNSLVSKCNREEAEVEEDLKDEGVENVLRRLVEASDDELGIPNYELIRMEGEDDQLGGVEFLFCDSMWEFEDITANYYDSFLQFEQFI